MAGTHLRGSRAVRAVLALLATLIAIVPLTAQAEYPMPIAGDEYAVTRSVYTNHPGLGQYVPDGFTHDLDGNIWTVEYDYSGLDVAPSRLVKYSSEGVLLAEFTTGLGLRYPLSVKFSPNGLLYIADAALNLSTTDDTAWDARPGDGRIIIVDPATGQKVGQFPTDGLPGPSNLSTTTEAMDRFKCPVDIDFATDGTYVVTDYAYNRVVKFDTGNQPLLAVGSITPGTGDTDFDHPTGSFVATDGALWVADSYNARVQQFSVGTTDAVLARSFSSGFTGAPEADPVNHPGVLERIEWPHDVFIDHHGVVYLTDWASSGDRFIRFTQAGEWLGAYRDTAAAPFYSIQIPWDIHVDESGAVWVMDYAWGTGVFDGALRAFGLNPGEPDITPPTTTSDAPESWVPGPRAVHLSANDASTTVAATYFSTDGTFPSESYVDSITISDEGTNTLKFFSVDRVGNAEDVVIDEVYIDSTPPTTTASVVPTYYGSAYIPFSAVDNLAGVQTTWFFVDAAGPYTDPAAISTQQGQHLLRYYSIDHAGNIEPIQSFVFTVTPPDEDPPQSTWVERRDIWFTENTPMTLIATDSVSGVEGIRYSLGGSEWTTYTAPLYITEEGTKTLEYYAIDLLGHQESTQTGLIRLDKTAPETIAEIPYGAIGSGVVTLTASDAVSGIQRTEWRLAGQPDFTVGTQIDLPTWGTYEIIYRSIDNAGNFEDVHNIEVTIERPDEIPPTTSSNIPLTGWVRGTPLRELVLISSDYEGGSGVSETVLSVDGGPWVPYVPGTHFFPEGQYEVRFYSVDYQDNHEEIHTEILRVDSTPPTSWSDAQEFYAGPAQINLYTEDNTSSALARYRLDSGPEILGSQILLSEYRSYTLEYWSVDGAGNEELPHHTMTIAVAPPDSTPPITTITAPTGWQKGFATFSLSAWDASSTIASTNFKLDDAWPQPYWSPVSVTKEGTTVVSYWSTDSFNNREDTKTAEVYVDASPPVTTSNAVTSYTDVAPIVLSPVDPYSGVSKTWYRINGGSWIEGTSFSVLWSRWRRYHTIEWYSTDAVGNIETKKSATFEIKLNPNPYQSSDSRLVYRGPWSSGFGGDARIVGSGPSWALVAFQGTQLELAARRSDDQGIMRASILDTDIAPVEFDLYDDQDRDGTYNPPAFTTGFLEYNDYIVKFEWTGTRNGDALDDFINIDEVRIEGVLTTVPDSEAPITTDDAPVGWVNGPVSVTLSSTDATTGVKGIYATSNGTTPTTSNPYVSPILVTAEGATTIRYFADDNRGNVESVKSATVNVDNTAPTTTLGTAQRSFTTTTTVSLLPVDALSGVGTSYWRLDGGSWNPTTTVTIPGASLGDHLLEWYSVDAIGNRETTRSASVTVFKRYEQTDSAILKRGTWSTATHDNHSSSTALQTTTSGSMIYVPFTGTRIDVIGSRGPAYGQARVRVDGGTPVVVDLYAGTTQYRSTLASMTALAPGFHVLTIEALNTKNAASSGYTVMFDAADIVGAIAPDTTAPTTTDSISPDWATTGQTVTLTPTDQTYVTSTKYRVNGSAWITYTAPFVVNGEGENLVQYYSTDLAGNVESTQQDHVRVDSSAPLVTDDAPNLWVQGPVAVHLEATDAGAGVESVLYSTDGSAPSLEYADAIVIDTQGTTTLSYRAVDALGNASAVATVAVNVDDVAPATTDDAPAGWVSGPVDVTLTSDDEHSGVVGIRYSLDGGTETTYAAPVAVSGDGTHTIAYFAIDAAGNVEDTRTVTVLLDATAPQASDDAPMGWVSGPVTVSLTATDDISGLDTILYSLDGSDPSLVYTDPLVLEAQGTTTLKYIATDIKGNSTALVERLVMIDDVAPVTTDDAPAGWVKAPVDVTLTASDNVSGVSATEYRIGTGDWVDYVAPIAISAEGTTSIEYRTVDVKGNAEDARTCVVRIDMTAPATTSDAAASYRTSATIRLTPTDALSGVSVTEYRLDGGDWAHGTQINVDVVGDHVVEWRSTDAAGNTEDTQAATFSISGRTEQTDSRMLFQTYWPTGNNVNHSGGSWRYASAPGAKAYVLFNGTAIDLIGARGPLYGQAHLRIDGGAPVLLDYYASSYEFNRVLASFSGLTDGEHILTIECLSTRNPASSGNYIGVDAVDVVGGIRADVTPPTSSDDAPTAWQTANTSVSLEANDSESWVDRIRYRINTGIQYTYTNPLVISTEGTTTVTYFAVDGANNTEALRTTTVRVDKTAPTTIDSAPGGWQRAAVDVALDATDAHSGVASVYVSVDDAEVAPYSAPLRVADEGTHTIAYFAADVAGNVEPTKTAQVLIDGTAPTTTDDAPTGWMGGTVYVRLMSEDLLSGVAGTEYRIGEGGWTPYTGTPIAIDAPGITEITYRSTDVAGNVEGSRSAFVRIDGDAPQTSADAPVSWANHDVTITLTATDTVNEIASTVFRIDGGALQDYVSPITFSEDGVYDLEFWSSDVAGNQETTQSVTVRVDKSAPSTTDDAPTGWSNVPVTVTLSASDALSGVTATYYTLDDGDPTLYTTPLEISEDGTHTITYHSVDAAGNAEVERQCLILVDRKAPLTYDDAPSGWVGGEVSVALTAGDPVSGVALTEYRVGSGEWTIYTSPIVVSSPGETTIEYRSTDAAGNTEDVRTTTVRIDGDAPHTTADLVDEWSPDDVVLSLDATDAVNPVAATFYEIAGEAVQLYTAPLVFTEEGVTPVTFWSIDTAGNVEATQTVSVRIDKTAPVTSNNAIDTYLDTAEFYLDPVDGASGIVDTVWTIDGGTEEHGTTITVGSIGIHTLSFASIDAAGNRESTQTVEFTVSHRFEQTSTEIGYTSGWKSSSNTFMSGGSYLWVDAAEQRATVRFTGRRLRLLATTNSSFGIAEVSVDGGTATDVDLYSPAIGYQRPVWDSGTLAAGEHTITVTWTGRKNPASSGTVIGIDALDIAGVLEQVVLEQPLNTFEQTDSRITYAGPWSTSTNSFMSGGSYAFSSAATGVANIKFVGSRVVLVTNTNSTFGIARVSVDGTNPVDVDLYSPSIAYQRKVFELGSLAETTHTVRIEWTGRKNPASTGTAVGLDAIQVAGTLEQADAAEVVSSFEQTDRHVVYEGTWSTSNNALMSGGSYKFTNTTSSTATIAFTGKRFEWYTAKSSSFGHAWVSVDGGAPTLVDLYAPSIQYKQRVWSSGDLTDGRHTVTITCAGTKNPASSGTNVGLDRIDMVGSITPVRYDQTHSMLAYDGTWGTSNNAAMSAGSYLYASADAALNVRFQGTSIAWLTAKSSNFGKANVYLDGVLQGSVDLYAPSIQYQQTVWDSGVLADGVHTLRIEWTGEKNPASTGTFVGVDALDCAGYFIPRRFEQTDVLVSQVGTWTTSNNTFMSGGSYMFATTTGTVNIAFRGTRFDWLTTKNSGMGIAQVSVDGGAPIDVDLYRSTLAYQALAWSSGSLANGNHTITISWTGRKNPASSGTVVGIDAIDVVGSLALRRYEQVSPGISYSTGWSNGNNALMSGGNYQYATSNGASATITFYGKQFDWVTIKSSSMGIAEVSIDGGAPQQVDLYSSSTKYKQTVFTSGALANGPHTVVITRTGTKNPAASNYYVGIDAVDLSGVLTTP